MYLKSLGSYSSHQLSGEFVFRGFLLQRFATKWGTSIATIVVAILFALLHVDFLGAAIFSIVLSIVYIRTKSLLMPIAIHMLNNAFVIGASFLISREKNYEFCRFLKLYDILSWTYYFYNRIKLSTYLFYLLIANIGVKKCQLYMQSRKKSFSDVVGSK